MQVTLSELQIETLQEIFESLPKSGIEESLSDEEKVEMALDALLNSYQSINEDMDTAAEAGHPMDADSIKKALQQVVNPNLSSDYTAPLASNPPVIEMVDVHQLWPDFKKQVPDNEFVQLADGDEDMERAVCMVLSQLPKEQWNLPSNKKLLKQALDILAK